MVPRSIAGCALALLLAGGASAANVLVITAHAGDYLVGAGGTLAQRIAAGDSVTVVQVTNDEKNSLDLGPAESQKANAEDARRAAKVLGVREVVALGHKSGELGYISSTELREEIFGLIRYFKPAALFIPDPYIHYDPNRDHYYVGRMAEDAWGYSGSSTFAPELNRVGIRPYGAPEVYYYAVARPYRPGEGGDGPAQFRSVDITAQLETKVKAVLALQTAGALYSAHGGSPRSFLTELAETVGRKHGFRYGEEFNYVGRHSGLPEHVRERASAKTQ